MLAIPALPPPLRLTAIALLALTFAFGVADTLLEPDQAWYAEIAGEMWRNGTPLSITHNGAAWLDKPHFQFWPLMLSFSLFGYGAPQAQLPAVVFALLALIYTYKEGARLYDKYTGVLAVWVLGSSAHFLWSVSDVRAEIIMAGTGMMAFHHLRRGFEHQGGLHHLAVGALAAACAFMTKGLVAVLPLAAAFAGPVALAQLRRSPSERAPYGKWLLAVTLMALCCTPAIYGYHQQFDANGGTRAVEGFGSHVSGVRFFLWDSQIGRFFNAAPQKGSGHPGFFVHTALWAFFPWAAAWGLALVRPRHASVWFAVVPVFVLLNLSKFQLPHYLVALMPWMALQVASVLRAPLPGWLRGTQRVLAWAALCLSAAAVPVLAASGRPAQLDAALVAATAVVMWLCRRHVLLPALGSLLLMCVVNHSLAPWAMEGQCGSRLAADVEALRLDPTRVRNIGWHSHAFAFATAHTTEARSPEALAEELTHTSPLYVMAFGETPLPGLRSETLSSHEAFKISLLGRTLYATGGLGTQRCELRRVTAE